MARARGTSLGAAVRQLLGVVPTRSLAEQLKYLTALRTGASKDSVASQLRVTRGTLQRWISGRQKPSKRSKDKIDALYGRFWRINNRVAPFRPDAMLRLSSPADKSTSPTRGIRVKGKARDHLILEQGVFVRNWQRLADATVREINADEGRLFVDEIVEIPYVELGPGTYVIETL